MQSRPPPLPPRPTMPPQDPASIQPEEPPEDVIERDMSEEQLRELYDSEEIDRFLSLFSAYVTEVQLQDDSDIRLGASIGASPTSSLPENEYPDHLPFDTPASSRPSSPIPSLSGASRSFSEEIAVRYLLPILPPSSPPIPFFTLGRLRLTTQRLYLAIQPVYGPFFSTLVKLATWKERKKSAVYCNAFWILWYYNLLLPCLFLRILYSLARRKIFSFPNLAELRAHRQEIDRANEFGQEMTTRFSASSSFGMKELWRLFKVFNKSKKTKVKKLAKEKTNQVAPKESTVDDHDPEQDMSTVLDSEDPKENSRESDLKRAGVQNLAEIADLHERVKNIFIWRRPASSRIYGMVLTLLFMITLFMPAKYLAKLTYFVGGFLFWHVTPVIAALSPSNRSRLPPAFADVPTDAEYAMELISQRVAAGLDVRPVRSQRTKHSDKKEQDGAAAAAELDDLRQGSHKKDKDEKGKDVNWKKWGERAAVGMTWAEDGKRIFTAGQWPQNTNRGAPAGAYSSVGTHTFPAQHTSAPGLITLTTETFFFTPLMASNAKLAIPLTSLRGVKKKSGVFTALTITWVDQANVKEEKFRWVGGRDELFTRLVGTAASDGKRRIKA
ncbi:hypothetical protein DFH07DRAFT_873983 [Mycena maculata]|uniref:Uncharacterized protein n=1 Tax=Mycena maculata TaxID=230809 RepID=A0AAD7KFW2_9AGAR|nr:hypothetical protein DFH07DRAFT_873983 [Mycena maculata]